MPTTTNAARRADALAWAHEWPVGARGTWEAGLAWGTLTIEVIAHEFSRGWPLLVLRTDAGDRLYCRYVERRNLHKST